MNLAFFGHWAFIIGLILAILAGFADIPSLPLILFILGLVVGFLNIGEKESTAFLVAIIALLMVAAAGREFGGDILAAILDNFIAFVSAAGLIVALKQVLAAAKPTA